MKDFLSRARRPAQFRSPTLLLGPPNSSEADVLVGSLLVGGAFTAVYQVHDTWCMLHIYVTVIYLLPGTQMALVCNLHLFTSINSRI